ncbi:acyl-CoA dehydrogenase family protein [Emcibacter sp.]|uniref:acyl-CoA dehydrogenase family protein n=1 Tax=Emcibacter sp. TaxID=1979954 RepID=UPI002AA6F942|nr:acyl-CoA dehydrogenase family protein [Emcibacter sp.]
MSYFNPHCELSTHEVTNQPPALENYNMFTSDPVLQEAVKRESTGSSFENLVYTGAQLGTEEHLEHGRLANENPPKLKLFDRFGQRIDEVEFHPSYHEMMSIGKGSGLSSVAWEEDTQDGHLHHAALEYMLHQVEAGVCCPLTMTYAGIPIIEQAPELRDEWLPKLISRSYDSRMIPAHLKDGCTMGMAMTEKQGGSDVRANSTKAVKSGDGYLLTGHKWFCSAPMSDSFLTLAYTDAGLSCFFMPRFRPDDSRNNFFIQRLKNKLGNHANASSEIEYQDTWAVLVGEEGRGVATIMDMVHHTRLDTAIAPVSLMRQALAQAVHHARHRSAFQKKLIDQPLMLSVLADLALDLEAGVLTFLHLAHKFDEASHNNEARTYARLAVAVAKFWHNKRCPNFVYECMECLGGAGYVEEGIMPRLYREAPLNSIWEGSGNVICLDILRTLAKEPEALDLFFHQLSPALGQNGDLDLTLEKLRDLIMDAASLERNARIIVEKMALSLQASLMLQYAPADVSAQFCSTRLGDGRNFVYGASQITDAAGILDRLFPQ